MAETVPCGECVWRSLVVDICEGPGEGLVKEFRGEGYQSIGGFRLEQSLDVGQHGEKHGRMRGVVWATGVRVALSRTEVEV